MAGVAASLDEGQHLYAVPCEDRILIGTTEQEYRGDPAAVAAEPEDISYLLQVARHFLRPEMLRRECVISAFAGLRVLPRGRKRRSMPDVITFWPSGQPAWSRWQGVS